MQKGLSTKENRYSDISPHFLFFPPPPDKPLSKYQVLKLHQSFCNKSVLSNPKLQLNFYCWAGKSGITGEEGTLGPFSRGTAHLRGCWLKAGCRKTSELRGGGRAAPGRWGREEPLSRTIRTEPLLFAQRVVFLHGGKRHVFHLSLLQSIKEMALRR